MKKGLGIIAILCCAAAFCVALVGCGANVDKSLYTGTWTLDSSSNKNFDSETIGLMRKMDATIDLVLNEDGSGTLKLLEGSESLTWKATSNTEGTATLDGNEMKLSLADGKLTLTDRDNVSMTFARKDAVMAQSSSAAASASASSASADASGAAQDASASSASAPADSAAASASSAAA